MSEMEVKGLYKNIEMVHFRETEGVRFDILPDSILDSTVAVDRVIHKTNAMSPGQVDNVKRPWYMHPWQTDNLVVLHGVRHVELYNVEHGKLEKFIVTPTKIYKNGELLSDYPAVLTWPPNVFHRVVSKEEGSAVVNFAFRTEDCDIKRNFDIYDLDTETGNYEVIREGHKDQFL
ncbi:MAG: hypothetical protein K9L74_00190 [Candidatus Izimaplasma sp.]|nr:hypothetical protein [Candidatus Izimaplasma bacterium]